MYAPIQTFRVFRGLLKRLERLLILRAQHFHVLEYAPARMGDCGVILWLRLGCSVKNPGWMLSDPVYFFCMTLSEVTEKRR